MKGTVLSSTNNFFRVLCADNEIRLCAIKGKRIKSLSGMYNSLAVGDEVEIIPTDGGKGLVASLYPRKNVFGRYNEKGRAEQAIAANIDIVFCIASPRLPPFRPRFTDRVAVMAEYAHVPFVIVMNKADLGISEEVADRLSGYEKLGYAVLPVSAKTGEGLGSLRSLMAGKVSVFAGQSGVGKSSLLNALVPGLERKTQDVSIKYDRGKHTTTMAEMITAAEGFRVIDTPGIRRLALRSIDLESLPSYFPEIAPLVKDCEFGARCTHTDEEGCAVRRAVEEGAIHRDRYESYVRIREELDVPVAWKRPGNRDPGRRERAQTSGTKNRTKGRRIMPFDHDELF